MPPAALVRMSVRTPSRPRTRVANVDRPEVVALVEVRAARERRDPPPGRGPDDELPGMPDHRRAPASSGSRRTGSSRVRAARRRNRPARAEHDGRRPATDRRPAAQRTRRPAARAVVVASRSQQEPGDRRGDEVRERAGQHRAQAEPRQVVPARRRQRADAADLDADRAEVREAAQREGRDRERARIERRASSARAASRRRTR